MTDLDVTVGAPTRERVVGAALRCLAARGLRHTTVDDVASEAGISRATLYRAFPGGRDTILLAVVDAERARLLAAISAAVADAPDLRGALVESLYVAATWLDGHEVVERLMFEEPAVLLTHVEFEQLDRTLDAASTDLAPVLSRFLSPSAAARAGEWLSRIVISYLLFRADGADLTERASLTAMVDRHVLPGVEALAADE